MQAERGARGGRGRRGGRDRPGGDRERAGAAAALARGGGGDGGGRRGRGRGFRGGRGGGAPRGGRREPGGRGGGASTRVEDDSDSETHGEENDEQGHFSRRKIVSNWDRYQDTEKEANDESGESQRGTDFSVLLSSAGDSFSQFRFAEEKEWDGETSCPKQNSALYVDSESLVWPLQQLPLSVRLNVAAELIQTTVPLELPQVKPRRNDGKELGMQLRGPISELRSAVGSCPRSLGKDSLRPSPLEGLQKAPLPPQSVADHLEDELDVLLHLDAPVKEEDRICPDQTSQDQEPEREGQVAQEETVPEKPSVTGEKNVEPEQTSTSKNVTEEELEDWLDSMIS
ncbi:cell death regulator Aven [Onychomys torridus]|uniref:cell death regulator Aven n=1 Tax=Onychomys torridus TaxID=38674 RepID=UPI00167FAA39|nr:cell death regulator Aven [Onychomys torridus]XP_036039735.1 cell death regulator Aven [Onychomys torridus]XP_036039736.1 cell death regulator Aven [Onychomys torridus]